MLFVYVYQEVFVVPGMGWEGNVDFLFDVLPETGIALPQLHQSISQKNDRRACIFNRSMPLLGNEIGESKNMSWYLGNSQGKERKPWSVAAFVRSGVCPFFSWASLDL
jgi:hypothetical protein